MVKKQYSVIIESEGNRIEKIGSAMIRAFDAGLDEFSFTPQGQLDATKAFKFCYKVIAATSIRDTSASNSIGGINVKVRRYWI